MPELDLALTTVMSVPFEENCYVARLADRQDCLVIDPGLEPEKILAVLEKDQLTPAAILNTHGHADHIAGNAALKRKWPACPLVIGAGDAAKLTDATLNLSAGFGMPIVSPAADVQLCEGQRYSAAGFDLDVMEIPGHSTGHIVFIWKGHLPHYVFGGDVLFAGSIGRTDFPDGSFPQLMEGIHRKLFTLPEDTVILPGHGPTTTIGNEKRHNPWVGAPAGFVDRTD